MQIALYMVGVCVYMCNFFCKVQQYIIIIIRILLCNIKGTIWDLHLSGMLHIIDKYLVTDALGKPIGPIIEG